MEQNLRFAALQRETLEGAGMPDGLAHSEIIRNRPFLLLWGAQAISQTAQNVITFALLIEVEQLSRSSVQASLVILAFTVPAILFGPIAGVFVDRADKRKVLLTTNLLRSGAVLGYIVVSPMWPTSLALGVIFLLSAAFSSITQFFAPAESATIPLLVDRKQLPEANSLFSLTFTSSQLAGFAFIGPLLIKLVAPETLFVIVAALYGICALLVALLPPLAQGKRPAEGGTMLTKLRKIWKEAHESWVFIAGQWGTIGVAIVDLAMTTSIFLMLGTLGVGLMTRVMGLPASDLAYVLATGGIGALLGLILVPRIFRLIGGSALVNVGIGMMGASILGMSVVHTLSTILLYSIEPQTRTILTLAVVMLLAAIIGVGGTFISIPAMTLLQERSPAPLRGRVFAALFTISSALSLFPVLLTGVLADLIGLQKVMALIGLLTLAVGVSGKYTRLNGRERE